MSQPIERVPSYGTDENATYDALLQRVQNIGQNRAVTSQQQRNGSDVSRELEKRSDELNLSPEAQAQLRKLQQRDREVRAHESAHLSAAGQHAVGGAQYQYQKGHRIGSRSQYLFWKYYYDGAEADYEREFGQPFPQQIIANENLKPGDAIYVDLDGNGVINENDMSRDYGYTDDPEYIAGLNLGFKWKDLSVNMQFTGAWNVSRYLSDVFMRPFQGRTTTDQGGLLKYHLDHTWTVDNPSQDAEYPRVTQTNGSQNYAASTLYEKDAKYLRLKTLEVAYDFHFPFMRSIGLNQLQLALSGYNLFTISPYIWGDPETRASASPSYPLQRTYTVSLKLGF